MGVTRVFRRPIHLAIVLAIAVILSSCGSPDLSRTDAAAAIEASPHIQDRRKYVALHSQAGEKGELQKVWRRGDRTDMLSDVRKLVLSEEAKKVIAEGDTGMIILHSPGRIKINVTGISDINTNLNSKKVDFSWEYTDLPRLAKRFAVQGGIGSALFKLYDDGWRLEEIDSSPNNQPMPLSTDEQAEDNALTTDATKNSDASRTIKRTLLSDTYILQMNNGPNIIQEVNITDVSIAFNCYSDEAWGSQFRCEKKQVWFGHIEEISASRGVVRIQLTRVGEYKSVRTGVNIRLLPIGRADKEVAKILESAVKDWRSRFGDVSSSGGPQLIDQRSVSSGALRERLTSLLADKPQEKLFGKDAGIIQEILGEVPAKRHKMGSSTDPFTGYSYRYELYGPGNNEAKLYIYADKNDKISSIRLTSDLDSCMINADTKCLDQKRKYLIENAVKTGSGIALGMTKEEVYSTAGEPVAFEIEESSCSGRNGERMTYADGTQVRICYYVIDIWLK